RLLTLAYPSAMWAAPCSWTTGTSLMPAGAKMSMASMKADPMMPNMSVTPLATNVSTNASDGVIRCTPCTGVRAAPVASAIESSSTWNGERMSGDWNKTFRTLESSPRLVGATPQVNIKFLEPVQFVLFFGTECGSMGGSEAKEGAMSEVRRIDDL